jgi:hypothetical protein
MVSMVAMMVPPQVMPMMMPVPAPVMPIVPVMSIVAPATMVIPHGVGAQSAFVHVHDCPIGGLRRARRLGACVRCGEASRNGDRRH